MAIGYALALLSSLWLFTPQLEPQIGPEFEIVLADAAAREIADLGLAVPVVGRVFVIVTKDAAREPRFQTSETGVPFWGMDVRGLGGGEAVKMADGDARVFGYPLPELIAEHAENTTSKRCYRCTRGLSDLTGTWSRCT